MMDRQSRRINRREAANEFNAAYKKTASVSKTDAVFG